jgi:hypothetical protein
MEFTIGDRVKLRGFNNRIGVLINIHCGDYYINWSYLYNKYTKSYGTVIKYSESVVKRCIENLEDYFKVGSRIRANYTGKTGVIISINSIDSVIHFTIQWDGSNHQRTITDTTNIYIIREQKEEINA